MPGQPRRRAMIAALEKRTRAYFDGDDERDRTHLDYVVEWVESGKTMRELSRLLAVESGVDIPTAMLGNYLYVRFRDAVPSPKQRLAAAREEGAHALAEDVQEVADERVDTAADAARARNRMAARQFLAGTWNRDQYGAKPTAGPAVVLNVGALHVEAMRARASQQSLPNGQTPAELAGSGAAEVAVTHALPSGQVEEADVVRELSDVM